MKTCPIHHLMLFYSSDYLGYKCEWTGCDYMEPDSLIATEASNPIIDPWKLVRYTVDQKGDKVTMKVELPPEFNMRHYERIFFMSEAKSAGRTQNEWVEYQKQELFKDMLMRFRAENIKM